MDKLLIGLPTILFEALLYEVLHRLYIVVGNLLYLLYPGSVLWCKIKVDSPQLLYILLYAETLQLLQGNSAEGRKVLYLYSYPILYKRILGEIAAQALHLS